MKICFSYNVIIVSSEIQQINGRKKRHFKFLAISNFPTFTNQQINSDLHVVHYLYDHKCSQFNRSRAEKNTISNFWRSQISKLSQINKSTNQQRFAHSLLFIRSQMFNIQQINSRKKTPFQFF